MPLEIYNSAKSEIALIGTIIQAPECLIEISDIINPADFYKSSYRLIYELCWQIYKEDNKQKQISLAYLSELIKEPQIIPELVNAIDCADIPSNAKKLAYIIKNKAVKRELQAYALNLQRKLKKEEGVKDVLTGAQVDLINILTQIQEKKEVTSRAIVERVKETIKGYERKKQIGLKIGMRFLEEAISAYMPGHLWVIGAWTSIGKTTLLYELVNRAYRYNVNPKVLVFSTEMTDEGNILKLVANKTGIPPMGILKSYGREKVEGSLDTVSFYNLEIVDNLYVWPEIYLKAKKNKITKGVDIIFIDFIQNIQGEGSIYERMSKLAPKMQELAKELKCTVIALSQLSNEEAAGGTHLKFKGAGEISAACDLGIILERGRNKDGLPTEDIKAIIKKNRWGCVGMHLCRFVESYTRIEE